MLARSGQCNDTTKMSVANARQVLALLCYCMATGGTLVVGPATCLSAMAADLEMSLETQKGLFLGAPFWGLGAMALFSGWVAQRLGYRLLLLTSSLLQTLGLLAIASATTQLEAMVGSLLLGLGRGMIAAPLTALLCTIYPHNRTGVANLFHAFFHIGMIALIALVLLLLHLDWDWRNIFVVFAALVAPCGLVGFIVPLPGASRGERDPHESDSLRNISAKAGFGLLVGSIFFGGATEMGATSWLPYFVEQAVDTSRELASLGLLCFALTMVVGRLAATVMVRRIGVKQVFVASGLVSALSVVLAALPIGTFFTLFWLTLLGLGVSGIFPTVLGYAGDRFPRANASLFAVLNSSAILGSVIAPAGVGLAADLVGLRPAMALLAIAPLCFLAAVLRLMHTHQSMQNQSAESVS